MNISIEKNDDGFIATCHDVDGAFAEGNTQFEALFNLFDVVRMIKDFSHVDLDIAIAI